MFERGQGRWGGRRGGRPRRRSEVAGQGLTPRPRTGRNPQQHLRLPRVPADRRRAHVHRQVGRAMRQAGERAVQAPARGRERRREAVRSFRHPRRGTRRQQGGSARGLSQAGQGLSPRPICRSGAAAGGARVPGSHGAPHQCRPRRAASPLTSTPLSTSRYSPRPATDSEDGRRLPGRRVHAPALRAAASMWAARSSSMPSRSASATRNACSPSASGSTVTRAAV